jgi:hypothetical protein
MQLFPEGFDFLPGKGFVHGSAISNKNKKYFPFAFYSLLLSTTRKRGMMCKVCYRFIFVFIGLLGTGRYMQAQMQFPGAPLGPSGQLKAAEVMYVLPPIDPMELESRMQMNRSNQFKVVEFATVRTVDLSPETHGSWQRSNGRRVWIAHIVSPGAFSLGLVFDEYRLKPGVKVFVYDPEMHHVKGAFTSGNNKKSGILPVGHLEGDEIIVELQVPEELADYGALHIESISHAYLDLNNPEGLGDCDPGVFGCSQACMLDVNCEEGAERQSEKRSVVRIFTTRQYCTGVLVNNTSYDGTPYILTAEHCISSQGYANLSVFLFDYESPACFGDDGLKNRSISGADLVATGDSIDFTLVRLSLTPPVEYKPYYAGWDCGESQNSASVTIHHPWGDVKKITSDDDPPDKPGDQSDVPYNDLDNYHYFSFWWIRDWELGSTQGGSSGSPLFNGAGKVIGTLSGGVARCGDSIGYDSEADRVLYDNSFNYDDYYTRIGIAWDYYDEAEKSLKPWMDPGNTGVTSLDGYEPNGIRPFHHSRDLRFHIFPNPATHLLHVSTDFPPAGKTTYEIISLNGTILLHGQLEASFISEVDISSLYPGVYMLRISGSQVRETHKLLISP